MRWIDLFDREILFVSGKGGTGKSTLAAALAAAAASWGRRVLLAEVEGRGECARTLGIADPGFEERPTPFGFRVLSITPNAAALEYIRLFVGLDRFTRTVLRAGALDQLIGAAPGFRDLLTCGKLYEITRVRRSNPRDRGRTRYDLVVVDAPPTGQIASFLAAPAAYADLIRVGRIQGQVKTIRRLLRERAAVALVTTLDEMAVAETLEALQALEGVRVPIAIVVANRALAPVVPRGLRAAFDGLSAADVARAAGRSGLALPEKAAAELLWASRVADGRHRMQRRFLAQLRGTGLAVGSLPEVSHPEPPQRVTALAAAMTGRDATRVDTARPDRPPGLPIPTPDVERSLADARITVVCGSGGVGKTTISAAIAVRRAAEGRRTILLTVDPARRLGTALRLPGMAGDRATVPVGGGRRLEAVQLDTQRTFDELVRRYAGSPERRDRILQNRFYRRIADTLAGTHEYMAMEKLYELAQEEDHEAIVIDTPPTRSALSFLDAPSRLTDFLGGRLLRWILRPPARLGRLSFGAVRLGAAAFATVADRLVGAGTVSDAVEFVRAFEGMYGGFKERAEQVVSLMGSDQCAFVVVTAPSETSLHEAAYFVKRLDERGMRAAAVVANRWHPDPTALPPSAAAVVKRLRVGEATERAVAAVLEDRMRREEVLEAEARGMARFVQENPSVPIAPVPELEGDVHDLRGLRRVAGALFDRRTDLMDPAR